MSASTRRRGQTLVEVAVVLAILSIVGGTLALVGVRSESAVRTESVRVGLEADARELVGRLTRELRGSSAASVGALADSLAPGGGVVPGPWDLGLSFDQPRAVDDATGAIDWRVVRVELRYAQGETDDGLDNDGDGLIDEGTVVMVRDWNAPNAQEVVLAHDVREHLEGELENGVDDNGNGLIDERGLAFERAGDAITVRVTLERRDHDGRLATRTASTTVLLRN